MADLRNNFVGIKSPNPFWLASAPPTDKAYNVERAFKAGWGGVVWKTLGEEGPPVVNVNGPRYGAIWGADRRLLGLNNIELITDRDLYTNLREMKQVKMNWPDRALIASIMDGEDILRRLGADVATAPSVTEAMEILAGQSFDLALLDVNLGDETSFGIADRLAVDGVPFVFATGYGEGIAQANSHSDAPVLQKPYTMEGVTDILARVQLRRSG